MGVVLLALCCLIVILLAAYFTYCWSVYSWYLRFTRDVISDNSRLKPRKRLISHEFAFVDYLYYSFTLSSFYLFSIAINYVRMRVRMWLWDIVDYRWLVGRVDDPVAVEEGIGYLLLDTSMAMCYDHVVQGAGLDGEDMCVFVLTNFHCPHRDAHGVHQLQLIRRLEVRLSLRHRRFIGATLDAEAMPDLRASAAGSPPQPLTPGETLVLLYQAISAHVHTAIHIASNAAFDLAAGKDRPLPAWFRQAARYTRGINLAATGAGFATYCRSDLPRETFAASITEAADSCTHMFEQHARVFAQLAPYSDYLQFMLKARTIIIEEVNHCPEASSCIADVEAYFIAVVVHPIDHVSAERIDPLTMYAVNLQTQGAVDTFSSAWTRALFGQFDYIYSFLLPTTRMRDSTVKWHRKAFKRMTEINGYLADQVDTCVSW